MSSNKLKAKRDDHLSFEVLHHKRKERSTKEDYTRKQLKDNEQYSHHRDWSFSDEELISERNSEEKTVSKRYKHQESSESLKHNNTSNKKVNNHFKSDSESDSSESVNKSSEMKMSELKSTVGHYCRDMEMYNEKRTRVKKSNNENYSSRKNKREHEKLYDRSSKRQHNKLQRNRDESEEYSTRKGEAERQNAKTEELVKNFKSGRNKNLGNALEEDSDNDNFNTKQLNDSSIQNLQYHKRQNSILKKTNDESKTSRRGSKKLNEERFVVEDSSFGMQKNQNKHGAQSGTDREDIEPLSKRTKMENINTKAGGAYIPPARLRMTQDSIKDKGSEQYQRIAWEALKKSIVGMTNKVNSANITEIVKELFKENIIRGKGILTRAIMQAQAASPTFTRVYAALVAIINSKFPEIGELVLKRLIIQYTKGFRRNDKTLCMTAARFLAHLLNQEVAHEVLLLEMVTHLLENPTDDSIEVAIATLKECGKKLTQLTSNGMRAITQRVRDVLHEGNADVRVRYMIEVFFAIQKEGFKDYEVISEDLDLLEEDDKTTHLLTLNFSSNESLDGQDMLNVFQFDQNYIEKEEKYKDIVQEILGSGSENEECEDSEGEDKEQDEADENQEIQDMTETNSICLRRKIYLTIQSSLNFEECCHKLLKFELKDKQILEMCYMILDCCSQQRTYEKFFGLLAQRFCQLGKIYTEPFTEIFQNSYKTIHRLETNKLRNVAKFFAHLLYTDAISWMVLSDIRLNEEDTTSSSRIFIKILFQELCEYMGLTRINERVKDVTLQEAFEGLFPREHPHNSRFAINFFTSIGLGGLTDELREHLKNLPKNAIPVANKYTSSSSSSSSSESEESLCPESKRKHKGKRLS